MINIAQNNGSGNYTTQVRTNVHTYIRYVSDVPAYVLTYILHTI